jgi:hypothetical protein
MGTSTMSFVKRTRSSSFFIVCVTSVSIFGRALTMWVHWSLLKPTDMMSPSMNAMRKDLRTWTAAKRWKRHDKPQMASQCCAVGSTAAVQKAMANLRCQRHRDNELRSLVVEGERDFLQVLG